MFIPGVHPSYNNQWQKLTTAYVDNKVNPFNCYACFVGNLLNGSSMWSLGRTFGFGDVLDNLHDIRIEEDKGFLCSATICLTRESSDLYAIHEIIELEKCFLKHVASRNYTEDALFIAFSKTLDLLKQIHLSKGEIIDEVPEFKRRVMV